MFEGTLVESRGLAGTGTKRWTALGSVTLQVGVAGLLVLIPMLRPEALPLLSGAPRMVVPLPPKAPPPVVRVVRAEAASSSAMSVPAASAVPVAATRGVIPSFHPTGLGPEPEVRTTLSMSSGPGMGSLSALVGTTGGGPVVSVAPAAKIGPTRVSAGVTAGMLLGEIRPVYPQIARAAHVEGTVVMEAVISKAGRIESLRAVSGPQMLRQAALDAVAAARYQPYKLNGEATEVETTITVVFRLGS